MTVKVKICGVTREDDAHLATRLGAAAIGFVFWPGSPRCVDPATARRIVAALPARILPVGVFVNQSPEEVARIATAAGLGAIQLHGDESPADYAAAGLRLIKSVAVGDGFDPASAARLPPGVTVLLDAADPIRRGGTGRTIDWTLAARVAATRETVLSGGLTPENVRRAVAEVRPAMIDVSSGVELSPGIKSHERLRALFEAL